MNLNKPRAAMRLLAVPVALARAPNDQPMIGLGVSEVPASSIIGGNTVDVVSVLVSVKGQALVAQLSGERAHQFAKELAQLAQAVDPLPGPEIPVDAIVGEDASGDGVEILDGHGQTTLQVGDQVYIGQYGPHGEKGDVFLERESAVKLALSILATIQATSEPSSGESIQ